MLTAEDCRRKAEEWRSGASAVFDSNTGARMHHVANLWTVLAEQIERTPSSKQPAPQTKRPMDAVNGHRAASIQIGDVLRERLRIGNDSSDENLD
jgi:hypothetical protein